MDREPSGLQSRALHRVGHTWSDLAHIHSFFVSYCSRSLCPGASSLARDPGAQPILVLVSVQASIRTQGVWLQVYLQHYTGLSLGGGGDPLRAERGTLGVLFGDLAPAELT